MAWPLQGRLSVGSHKETSDTAWINVPAKYLRQHYVVFVLIDNSCITLKSFLTSLLPWGTFSECFIYNQMHIIRLCKAVLKVQFHKVSLFFPESNFFPSSSSSALLCACVCSLFKNGMCSMLHQLVYSLHFKFWLFALFKRCVASVTLWKFELIFLNFSECCRRPSNQPLEQCVSHKVLSSNMTKFTEMQSPKQN